MEDERFIVWMQIAPFAHFRKSWGKIDQDIPKGKYVVDIQNNWDTTIFDGSKKFVLTETNKYGGRNLFLGYSYAVIGGLSLLSGIIFSFKLCKKEEPDFKN